MQPSPYDTPPSQFADPSAVPPPLAGGPPPGSIKVFGILHLVIAGFGIIGGIWTVVTVLFFADFIAWTNRIGGGKQPDALQQAQIAYMDEIAWITWLNLGFSVVLTVLLIIAGINLLRNRDKGRVVSIRYAWTSIGTKIVGLALMLVYAMPAASRMNEAILGDVGGQLGNAVGAVTTVSSIIGMASSLVYPILVLFIVNSEKVRNYLAGR